MFCFIILLKLGLDMYIKDFNPKYDAPSFKNSPLRIFRKFWNVVEIFENCQKSQFRYLKTGVLELRQATTIKPRKIERSGFFLLDHNRQTRIYRVQQMLGSGEIVIF